MTLKLRPSDAPTTPPMGGRAPLPAAAGSRGIPTATSNQRVERRAAILARGHCACATRLKAASRGRRTRAEPVLPGAGPAAGTLEGRGRRKKKKPTSVARAHPHPVRFLGCRRRKGIYSKKC